MPMVPGHAPLPVSPSSGEPGVTSGDPDMDAMLARMAALGGGVLSPSQESELGGGRRHQLKEASGRRQLTEASKSQLSRLRTPKSRMIYILRSVSGETTRATLIPFSVPLILLLDPPRPSNPIRLPEKSIQKWRPSQKEWRL